MKTCGRFLISLVLLLTISHRSALAAIAESPADPAARNAIELLQQGHSAEALQGFDSPDLPADANRVLQDAQAALPASGTSTIDLVNRSLFKAFQRDYLEEMLVYHVKGHDKAALVFIAARTASGVTRLKDIRVQPAPIDLRDAHPFRLSGMSPLHYIVLLLAVVVSIFMLTTAVACVRSKRRRKWLWLAFILIGIGQFGIQWVAGGQYFLRLLSFQLFGAFALKYPLYDPWVIGASLPLGAILFWATNSGKPMPLQTDGAAQASLGTSAVTASAASSVTSSPIRYVVGGIGFLLVWLTVALVVSVAMITIFPPRDGSDASVAIGLAWRCLPGIVLGIFPGIHSFRASVRRQKGTTGK